MVGEKRTDVRSLTPEEIVERSIGLLESGGLEHLTMRRLAEACDVTPMALYRHVRDKDKLLELITDQVFGRILHQELRTPWREAIVDWCNVFRETCVETPAFAELVIRRSIPGPHASRVTERLYEALHKGGFRGELAVHAHDSIYLFTLGAIGFDAFDKTQRLTVRADSIQTLSPSEIPLFASHLAELKYRDPTERFLWGINVLLDGLEDQLTRAKASPGRKGS